MTRFLTRQQVEQIHALRSDAPLLYPDRLDAAVAQPALELSSGYAYESIFLQASVLLHRLATGHAFLDGNKRTAWLACVTFLELNGIGIRGSLAQQEVVEFIVAIVTEHLDQERIARWVESISTPLEPSPSK